MNWLCLIRFLVAAIVKNSFNPMRRGNSPLNPPPPTMQPTPELTKLQKQMIRGLICPYCKKQTQYAQGDYGMIYLCKPCDAYCGVHKNSNRSLGRLAKADLRQCRQEAHKHFDVIWAQGQIKRKELYKELAEYLQLPSKYCHIAMFSISTCQKVTEWAKQRLNDMQNQSNFITTANPA